MTMTLAPIDEVLKALDTPEAVADRRKRAQKLASSLVGDERNATIHRAGQHALARALSPRQLLNQWSSATEHADAELQIIRNVDALVVDQCEHELRRADEQAIYQDPDRVAENEIWQEYTKQVSSVAWAQGDKSDRWIATWQELIRDRQTASEFGESTSAIDARLEKMVGVPFPRFKSEVPARSRGRK